MAAKAADDYRITGDIFFDLHTMHERFGFNKKPMSRQELFQRINFLQEELDEIKDAFDKNSSLDLMDGLIDLIVVAAGTVDRGEADGEIAWERVMRANLSKKVGFNTKRPHSTGNDLIKPKDWQPPDLEGTDGGLLGALLDDLGMEGKFKFDLGSTKSFPAAWFERLSGQVLLDCIRLMYDKSRDYAVPGSPVQPADYYPNGADDFVYMIDVLKKNRQTSILHAIKNGTGARFESLQDTLMDRINYLALFVEWMFLLTPGQDPSKDAFGRPKEIKEAK